MTGTNGATPIEDYLDELLRRACGDPRAARRLLDETSDHLSAAAAALEEAGVPRVAAEREAVRRFGAAPDLARTVWRRSFGVLVVETLRAAILLGACGLVAVGLSGGVAAILNGLFGPDFVGGATVLGTGGSTVAETGSDAVVLRVLAGVAGLLTLGGYALLRRHTKSTAVLPTAVLPTAVLPRGLVDALGAAAFAAATVVLTAASVDQAATGVHGHGVGFFLSGALVAASGAVLFSVRATRVLISSATFAAGTRGR